MSSEIVASRVFSATPTPLADEGGIDEAGVRKCIDHHVHMGCDGVMLAGTCGEGPWLRDPDLQLLVKTGVEQADGRLQIGAQVTDNSPGRILDRLENLAEWKAGFGVVAQPYFFMNATPKRLLDFYLTIFDKSPLPIFFYDRGKAASVSVPSEILGEIVSHSRVIGVKDSSCDPARFSIISEIRRKRPELQILTGDEFNLMESLHLGYNGAFFGGAVLTAKAVRQTLDLFAAGRRNEAKELDAATREVLLAVYGGPKITCWLSGLKYALVRLGIFSGWRNILEYPLTDECRSAIDQAVNSVAWLRP